MQVALDRFDVVAPLRVDPAVKHYFDVVICEMAWMLLLKSEVDDGFRRQLGGALAPPPSRSGNGP